MSFNVNKVVIEIYAPQSTPFRTVCLYFNFTPFLILTLCTAVLLYATAALVASLTFPGTKTTVMLQVFGAAKDHSSALTML